jgi:2,5-diamino-6-(ribosylamino)-4(3H)-pyrimidinone 5'-phosphate reductase
MPEVTIFDINMIDITRPKTTLYMLISVDGKISTGDNDSLDVDQDYPEIGGVREGLHQYYQLEKKTDRVSLNTGLVMAKVGANERDLNKNYTKDVNFVVVDNKPHLNEHGTEYFAKRSGTFFLVTTNKNHPAFKLQKKYQNIEIYFYKDDIDFADFFRKLKYDFKIKKLTIQSGGTLNALLLRAGLIDYISFVVAPCLIGGKNTKSVIEGESLHTIDDLHQIKALKLMKCTVLKNSYLHLKYKVLNES